MLPDMEMLWSVPNAVRYISSCQSVLFVPKAASAGTPVTVGAKARNSSALSTFRRFAVVLIAKFAE